MQLNVGTFMTLMEKKGRRTSKNNFFFKAGNIFEDEKTVKHSDIAQMSHLILLDLIVRSK